MAPQSSDDRVPVAVAGLGHIGREVARAVLSRPELELVGALEADPALVGKSLAELLDVPKSAGLRPDLRVEDDEAAVLKRTKGGVLLQLTGSRLPTVLDQIQRAIKAGVNVISSCEELAFPWLRHAELADALEETARKADIGVLGTGVNPGFVLDRLIATLGEATGHIQKVQAERVVDAGTRREQLQRKVGAGLTREKWDHEVDAGTIGHIGLSESAALISAGLGLDCEEFDETIDPVIAHERITGPSLDGTVEKGHVAGCHQTARGFSEGREVVSLSLTIAVGAKDPRDEIHLFGQPEIHIISPGGIAGDRATAWTLVNAIPALLSAEPGLLTVLDLPAGR
jgi:4-hydroxy-tetrahydrodipicolinate reductase